MILLFKYDPDDVLPLPRITSVDPHTLLISVPSVRSIMRRRTSDGLTIASDVGRIEYPGPEDSE